MIILSSEEGRYLSEMFPSFLAKYSSRDDSKSKIQLRTTEFHYYNNSPNLNLYMSIPSNDKPYFYVQKQIPRNDEDKKQYFKSIQNETKILSQNLINKNDYEKKYNTKIYDCKNVDRHSQYSPFISVGIEENKNNTHLMSLPFYPGMSLSYLISQKAKVTDTDKQIWAYELSCAFSNLHQRGLYHTFFTSGDAFLTPNLIDSDINSQKIHLNVILGSFSYDLDSERVKSKQATQFYYRSPEFVNEPLIKISNASPLQHQRNDVHAFGVFLIELLRWESPQLFLPGVSRKERFIKINSLSPQEYLNIKVISNSPWVQLILKCVDKCPENRPTFDVIKNYLSNSQYFLQEVDPEEFEYRISNIITDTTCYFETLAYANIKYPNFQIISLILEEIRNEIIQQYSINYDTNNGLPVVQQLFQILNSPLYFLNELIHKRKEFFTELFQYNFYDIIKTYTKNEVLIKLIRDIVQNNDIKDGNEYRKYQKELMPLIKDLRSLSDLYYDEAIGKSTGGNFFSPFHCKDIEFLFNQFNQSIPISEGQIQIIYKDLFNFDYIKSVEFLTKLTELKKFNTNYFESLEKVYTILNESIKNQVDTEYSMDIINNIYKEIYKAILTNINNQTNIFFSNDSISSLFNKIHTMLDLFTEDDKLVIIDCLNILKIGLKIKQYSNYSFLSYAGPAVKSISTSTDLRSQRTQSKTIDIYGMSKSSLRTFLTRIVKSYQAPYVVQITLRLKNNDNGQLKMANIVEILNKLGVTDINIQPNFVSFFLNRT